MGTDLETVLEDTQGLLQHIKYLCDCLGKPEDKKIWEDRIELLEGQLKDSYEIKAEL